MSVYLRLEEQNKFGDIVNSVWLLTEFPNADDDCVTSDFDLGYPSARVASYTYTEANGAADLTQYHDASTVTVDAALLGDNRWFLQDQLRSMCLPNKRLFLYIKRPEWDQERWMQLRANSFSFHSDKTAAVKWPISLSFSNPSGVMNSIDQTNKTFTNLTSGVTEGVGYGTLLYGGGLYGIRSGASLGLITGYGGGAYGAGAYGQGNATSGNELVVFGTVPVLPRITIKGAFSDLKLTFNSVGTAIYLKGLTVADGDFITIDVPSSQILLNGQIAQSKLTFLSIDPGDGWNGWPTLTTGSNYVAITAATHGDNFSVTFTYRDTWA